MSRLFANWRYGSRFLDASYSWRSVIRRNSTPREDFHLSSNICPFQPYLFDLSNLTCGKIIGTSYMFAEKLKEHLSLFVEKLQEQRTLCPQNPFISTNRRRFGRNVRPIRGHSKSTFAQICQLFDPLPPCSLFKYKYFRVRTGSAITLESLRTCFTMIRPKTLRLLRTNCEKHAEITPNLKNGALKDKAIFRSLILV